MTMTPGPNRQMRSNLVVASVDPSEGAIPSVLVHDQRFSAGVTATSIYTGGPRFSPDGKAIVYDITDKGIANLWMQPLDGSAGRQDVSDVVVLRETDE